MKPYSPVNIKHKSILLTLLLFITTLSLSILIVFGGLMEWSLSHHFNDAKVLFTQQCLFLLLLLISISASIFIYKSDPKKQYYSMYEASSSVLNQLNGLGENDESIKKAIRSCYALNNYIDTTNASKIIQYKNKKVELNKLNKANNSLQNI